MRDDAPEIGREQLEAILADFKQQSVRNKQAVLQELLCEVCARTEPTQDGAGAELRLWLGFSIGYFLTFAERTKRGSKLIDQLFEAIAQGSAKAELHADLVGIVGFESAMTIMEAIDDE